MRTRSRARKASTPAPQAQAGACSGGWGGLHRDCLALVFAAVGRLGGTETTRAWASLLSVNKHWRSLAQELPLDACVPPSRALIGWLRCVKLRRLEFLHGGAERGDDLGCQGFTSSEQRYRAAISTLLATLDFIKRSGDSLQVLAGVHPREGILYLHPFQCLESISMSGTAGESCKMVILAGLPRLRVVFGCGFGEYTMEGLPPSVRHLNLQWSMTPGASFAAIDFQVPEGCSLDSLTLCSQRPLCLGAPCLARCATLRLTARRCYLGLPLRRGAPWADVDDLAARFAQFMLGGALESVEVTATRLFVFQPVHDAFDLSNNEGVGGVAQHEQLATALLARHFQSLHVEQRMLAVGAFRSFLRITRRRAEPVAFSFTAPLHREQLDFLQQHALATSISFGPVSLCDAVTVLNHPGFAERNAPLLHQLAHLEISSQLNLAPYTALHSLQGMYQSEPQVALGAAQLSSLRLTPVLGAAQAQRAFHSQWLRGVQQLGSLQLMRFACADLSHLGRGTPSAITLSSLQPPSSCISADTLQLPPGGFGPGCTLQLKMAYAPPHAIHAAAGDAAQQHLIPGGLAAALQQHAAAAAAAADQAIAALNAQQPQPAGPQDAQAQAQEPAGGAQQHNQQQHPAGLLPGVIDLVSDDEEDDAMAQLMPPAGFALAEGPAPPLPGGPAAPAAAPAGPPHNHPPQWFVGPGGVPAGQGIQAGQVLGAFAGNLHMAGNLPLGAAAAAAAAAAAGDVLELDSEDDDDDMPGLMDDDGEDVLPLGPPGFLAPQGGGLGPWVMVQAQQQGGGQLQGPNLVDFGQPWPEPDDRLSDVTIRHNALWGAAGSLSVSAGALTVVYSGAGPADLLTLLTGGGSGGPSALRTLRLSARSLRFAAVSAKAGGSQGAGGQQGGQGAAAAAAAEAAGEQQQEEAPPAANEHNSCSGTELRDFISGSEWAAVWEVKLQRSLIRGQEVLVLARRQPPPVAASPAVAPALAAAAAPATL